MNLTEYIELAQRTSATRNYYYYKKLQHAAYGLSTEIGEFIDQLKRTEFYNKKLDIVNLEEEIGDIFWYLAEAMAALKSDPNKILERNIEKLKVRFPEKYTDEEALNRNLNAERDALEGN